MSNVTRTIVKKLAVKFEENETMGVDNFNVFEHYRDLWKTESDRQNTIRQGLIHSSGSTVNCMKLQINAGNKGTTNKQDKAIADTYGNKFIIPLDIELLGSIMSFYQSGLGNRLCYEIMFNDYD